MLGLNTRVFGISVMCPILGPFSTEMSASAMHDWSEIEVCVCVCVCARARSQSALTESC